MGKPFGCLLGHPGPSDTEPRTRHDDDGDDDDDDAACVLLRVLNRDACRWRCGSANGSRKRKTRSATKTRSARKTRNATKTRSAKTSETGCCCRHGDGHAGRRESDPRRGRRCRVVTTWIATDDQWQNQVAHGEEIHVGRTWIEKRYDHAEKTWSGIVMRCTHHVHVGKTWNGIERRLGHAGKTWNGIERRLGHAEKT